MMPSINLQMAAFPAAGGGGSEENFGDETAGTDSFPCDNGRAMASKYTADHSGTVTSMHLYFHGDGSASGNVKCAIHEDDAGTIGDLVGVSSSASCGSDEWVECSASITLSSSGDYWLVAVTDNFNPKFAHLNSGPTSMIMANGTYSYASPPSTWPGTDATYDGQLSIYATLEY